MKLVKKDKKHYKNIYIYCILITLDTLQLKKIDDCESIYSVNPLHLFANHANGYIEEKNGKKYLIFDDP